MANKFQHNKLKGLKSIIASAGLAAVVCSSGCKSVPYGVIQGSKDTLGTVNYLQENTNNDSLSWLGAISYPAHALRRFGEKLPEDAVDFYNGCKSIYEHGTIAAGNIGNTSKEPAYGASIIEPAEPVEEMVGSPAYEEF